jgi:signal transduction histidine kinase
MQSIAQRLRELGRRFAGNRTEIEAIRDQLQQVVGSLSERVLLLDRERRVIMASPEAEKMLSGGRFTLRGQRLSEALSHSHPITALTERAYQSGQSMQEVATFSVNGAGQQAVVASLQMFEDRGQPAGALLTLRDFETLQRLETQLDFATKLAALNRITAGVAHEVKNPLHAMVLHLELLNAKLDADLDPKPHVDILMSEVTRLKRVVQTFLDFTRPVELKLRQIDANALTREVVMLAADARAQGIHLQERYGSGPLLIKADPDLLKQAILNIIINGCQVMPHGGRLAVETGRDEENHVFITITDSGPGIPEEIRDKIFNLYYTTKPTGSGIGLAQAFRAVQLHNGRIKVESEVGAGACFRIILPAA